jgi:hypothetical protein
MGAGRHYIFFFLCLAHVTCRKKKRNKSKHVAFNYIMIRNCGAKKNERFNFHTKKKYLFEYIILNFGSILNF